MTQERLLGNWAATTFDSKKSNGKKSTLSGLYIPFNLRYVSTILIMLFVIGIGNVWGSGSRYGRGQAYLKDGCPTGSGKVYVSVASSESSSNSGWKDCTTTAVSAELEGAKTSMTFTFQAQANNGYKFTGWYSKNADETYKLLTKETTYSVKKTTGAEPTGTNDAYTDVNCYAEFIKIVHYSFIVPEHGSYTITNDGVAVANYATIEAQGVVHLVSQPDEGYRFAGWYTTTDGGTTRNYFSFDPEVDLTFTTDVTVGVDFRVNNGNALFYVVNGGMHDNLATAITQANSISPKVVTVAQDGRLAAGSYTIPSAVTLLIQHNKEFTIQTKAEMVKAEAQTMAYRRLTMSEGANIICNGKICVAGKQMCSGGGHPSGYTTGACGVIDMSSGGKIQVNSGGKLYCWGFIKGQDMTQGNNTVGMGNIVAKSGAEIWENFAVGDWRGGTACSNIQGSNFFPFQSYFIQNIEVPLTIEYGAENKCYASVNGNSTDFQLPAVMIGKTDALFKLSDANSVVRKWYDPTTDLMCFELSGTANLDAVVVKGLPVIGNVSSADYYLPISSNMHIILTNSNVTISKKMVMQAGAKLEIKNDASVTISSNVVMYDKDDWGPYAGPNFYFHNYGNTYGILSIHKNRGNGKSKDLLDDAQFIVDGQLNVTGKLYTTAGGADIMGNGGGKVQLSAIPTSATTIDAFTSNGDEVSGGVTVNSANLHNEDDTYTKSIASTTFNNIYGRWFASSASSPQADHTYNFTYISSGQPVSGSANTIATTSTPAVYGGDKTGLAAGMKWCNVQQDATCPTIYNATQKLHDTEASNIKYTYKSKWIQLLKSKTEGVYEGSDNNLYAIDGCTVSSLGTVDGNCLYTIDGVKKAIVNGTFVALVKNDDDEAFHDAANDKKYYVSFTGCKWHPATKYPDEEKAYIVEGSDYIWYNNDWLPVEREEPYFFDYNEQNVKRYYTYENGAWVLASPCIQVTDAIDTEASPRLFYFLPEAFTVAFSKKNATIKLLKNVTSKMSPISCTTKNTTYTFDLNGHTATAIITGAGTSEIKMFDINAANTTFTITDNSAEKNGKFVLKQGINTATATKRWHGIYITNGFLVLDAGEVDAINDFAYTSTSNSGMVSAITIAASKTFTMNGGTVYAESPYYPRGINVAGTSAKANLYGGTITAYATKVTNAMGIYTVGGTTTINPGVTINATTTTTTAYGIYIDSSKSGYAGTVNMTGGTINVNSTTTTAYGVYVQVNATGKIPGKFTMSGGEVNVTSGTHTVYGIFVNKAAADASTIYRAVANISGGTFNVTSTTTPSKSQVTDGIRSYGTTTITGSPIFNVTATGTYAWGLRIYDGKTTISGTPTFTVRATQYAYGAVLTGTAPTAAGVCTNAELVINNGTFDIATTSTTYAYGVVVSQVAPLATEDPEIFYESPSKLTIKGGQFTVVAKTTTAQGVNVGRGTLMAGTTPNTLLKETLGTAIISGGTFDVSTLGTTTAQGITNSGNTTVSNATFNVTPKTTTAYGARCYHGLLTINNGSVFNVKATANAYGIVAGNEKPTTAGILYDAEAVINGGTINVETTSKATIYGLWASRNSLTIATGTANEGNYASAGKITVNDGEIKVKAKTNPAYAVLVDAAVTQAGNTDYPAATATPQAFINGGKFFVTATSSKNYAVSSTPLAENVQITGGYYNSHTTQTSGTYIDKYIVSPNKKLSLAESHALYPDGYRYEVAEAYFVTFNMQGHGDAIAKQTIKKGQKVTKPTAPTEEGYTFGGWYQEAECTNTWNFSTAITEDVQLYAKWTANTYNITYKNQGNAAFIGTHQDGYPKTHTYDAITTLDTPTRTGYTFGGWYTSSDCSTEPITIIGAKDYTAAFTLYAKWTPITYNIIYKDQGGADFSGVHAEGTPTTHTYATATALKNPTKVGYTFGGWFIAEDCSGTKLTSLAAAGYTADITLHAKWTINTRKLTWNWGGGATSSTTHTAAGNVTYGTEIVYPAANTMTKANYAFTGWDKSNTTMPDENLTITAQWVEAVASVTVGGATTYYATIADAWDFVNDQTANTTIKLLQDATTDASLVFTPAAAMTCTLNLNNHTLSGAVNKLININLAGSTFVIDDSSNDKNGKILADYSVNDRLYGVYLTAGTLNLKAGHIHSKNPHTYSSADADKNSAATGLYVTKSQKFTMDGGTIESESQYNSIAIFASESGTTPITINDGRVYAHTTASTTAIGIYTYAKNLEVNDGTIIGHAYTSSAYGVYVRTGNTTTGIATFNGGRIEATNDDTKGTTTAYGIYARGSITIPSTSTVDVFAQARTNTAYAVFVYSSITGNTIAGGTFTAIAKTGNTAGGISNAGTITISGGTFTATTKTTKAYGINSSRTTTINGNPTFNVTSGTTTAYGIYATRGTTTVNGDPTFNVTAGSTTAYGALAYGTIGNDGTGKYSGTINIKGGTFNVTSTKENAWGAYAALISKTVNDPDNSDAIVGGTHYMPGIISITDGTFNVKAKTTAAYGIVVAGSKKESGEVGTTARYPKATVTGGEFKVESEGDDNATAYATNTSATASYLIVQGGKYSTKRTNASATPNIEDKYTAPTKSCNYHVLPLEGEDPYKWEVAEAYIITFKNEDGTTLQSTAVKKNATPAYTGSTPTKAADAQYTYTFNGWSPAITTVTQAATYTATYTSTVNQYTIRFIDGDGNVLTNTASADNKWDYGSTPYYTGDTPTKTEDDDFTYAFNGTWSPAIASVTDNATYNAVFDATRKDLGAWLDIVDWVTNGSGDISAVVVNMNNYVPATKKAQWKVAANGKEYTKTDWNTTDHTLSIDLSGLGLNAGDKVPVAVHGVKDATDNLDSYHFYTVPMIVNNNTTLTGTGDESIVYVRKGTLTVNNNATVGEIYVAPGAELLIESSKKLTVTKLLVMRTEAFTPSILTNNGTLTITDGAQMYYSRRVADNSQYFQLGLPFDVTLGNAKLSLVNDKPAVLGTHFGIKTYDAASRAQYGKQDENWVNQTKLTTLSANTGYQMLSSSPYYYEIFFPVTYSKVTESSKPAIEVSIYSPSNGNTADQGWNYICSPFTHVYTGNASPTGLKVSELLDNNTAFYQYIPDRLYPAMPFYYQATESGTLQFGTSLKKNMPRRAPESEIGGTALAEIEWLRLHYGLSDNNKGVTPTRTRMEGFAVEDQTNIFLHPSLFSNSYNDEYEAAKWSVAGERPFIYTSLAYGNLAFAALPDTTELIPVTVYNPSEGEMRFALADNNFMNRLDELWLIDTATGEQTDLLYTDYTYYAFEAGTERGRFFLRPVIRSNDVATDIVNKGANGGNGENGENGGLMPRKIMIDGYLYILMPDGKVYDAVGRKLK